jgi:hypothetical protein
MKLIIVGSRSFDDGIHTNYQRLEKEILARYPIKKIDAIISGGAVGTDTLAQSFAKKYGLKMIIFYPNWNKYGNRAGALRNMMIVKEGDEALVFHDGESRGTTITIKMLEQKKKKFEVISI